MTQQAGTVLMANLKALALAPLRVKVEDCIEAWAIEGVACLRNKSSINLSLAGKVAVRLTRGNSMQRERILQMADCVLRFETRRTSFAAVCQYPKIQKCELVQSYQRILVRCRGHMN